MSEQSKTRPEWLGETGVVSVALPEPPLVRKYSGGQPRGVEEEYERALSEQSLESLAAPGVTLVWVRFYSGFGLEFEKAEIERARDFIVRAQARGLHAAAALQFGLVVPETLLLEEPECHNWLQVNADGQHVHAGAGVAGVRPCYNCEGFMRYIERACLLAVDSGADLVHLDNTGYNLEPDTCRCALCVAAFRDFLRQQYGPQDEKTREAGLARFGHNSFTHVRPPAMAQGVDAVGDVESPHEQEWIKFKVHTLAACLGRLARAISRRDPECAVGAGLTGFHYNREKLYGISCPAHLPLVDLVRPEPESGKDTVLCTEFAPEPAPASSQAQAAAQPPASADKFIHSQWAAMLRELLTARAFGLAVETGHWLGTPQTTLALHLMFNQFGLGRVAHSSYSWMFAPGWQEHLANNDNLRTLRAYLDFYAKHKAALLGARSLAALAFYHDTAGELFSPLKARLAFEDLDPKLAAAGWNCEPLYQNQLAYLSRYRCVVVACAWWLAEETAQALKSYVESGGGIVVLSVAGLQDEWGRRRPRPLLETVFAQDWSHSQPLHLQTGAGRVAFVPSLDSIEDLDAAVTFAAGGPPPWSVEAAGARPLSWAVQAADGTLLLHVAEVSGPALPAGLHCSIACDKQPQRVLPCAPGREFVPLAFTWEHGRASFELGTAAADADGHMPKYLLFRVEVG